MGHAGARRPREDVARPDLDRLLLLLLLEHGQRRRPELEGGCTLEEDEQLLVGGVAVRWRAVVPALEAPVVDARVLRARLAREQHPAAGLALVGRVGVGEVEAARRLRLAGAEGRRLRRRCEQQCRQAVVAGTQYRWIVRDGVDDAVARLEAV